MRTIATLCLVSLLSCLAAAQEPPAPAGPGVLKLENLKLDVKNRRIVIDAEVTAPTTALEFLLVRTGGKEYESLLRAKIKGSDLHAALLALNLVPGKPARMVEDPLTNQSRFMPPQGPAVTITLRYKDAKGQLRERPAGDWMAAAGQKKVTMPDKWIFVGSQFLPDGRYWADVEGETISVSNFASAVLDVPFESSNKEALMDFVAKGDAMPPAGTAVEVIIQPVAGEGDSPHARIMVEIDAFGRLRLDGRPVLLSDLRTWAEQFISRHPKGLVQIRASGRALVHDVEQVRLELKLGGVWDVEIIHLPAEGMLLPRTRAELERQIKWWDEQFADAKELIRDPGEDAQAVLDQVQNDIKLLRATQALWEEYGKVLRDKMQKYQASTQPAKPREGK